MDQLYYRWTTTGDLPESMEVWAEETSWAVPESCRCYQRAPLLLQQIVTQIIFNWGEEHDMWLLHSAVTPAYVWLRSSHCIRLCGTWLLVTSVSLMHLRSLGTSSRTLYFFHVFSLRYQYQDLIQLMSPNISKPVGNQSVIALPKTWDNSMTTCRRHEQATIQHCLCNKTNRMNYYPLISHAYC